MSSQTPSDIQAQSTMLDEKETVSSFLADLKIDKLPRQLQSEGHDWHAIHNPRLERAFDIEHVESFPHDSIASSLSFSSDGLLFATGSDRLARVFDVDTGSEIRRFEHHLVRDDISYVRKVCFSPDGLYLATGSEDSILRESSFSIWEISSCTLFRKFVGHEAAIYGLQYMTHGRCIVSGSDDRTIRIWDIMDNSCIFKAEIPDTISSVAVSSDNLFFAAGRLNNRVYVWDATIGRQVDILCDNNKEHTDYVYSITFSPRSTEILSASCDGTMKMWSLVPPSLTPSLGGNIPAFKFTRTFDGHKNHVISATYTPDGKFILSGSRDRGMHLWDPLTGDAHLRLEAGTDSVIAVAANPALEGVFATSGGEKRVSIWRYKPYGADSLGSTKQSPGLDRFVSAKL